MCGVLVFSGPDGNFSTLVSCVNGMDVLSFLLSPVLGLLHDLVALFLGGSGIQPSSDCICHKLHTWFHMLGTEISELGHEDFHNFHTFHLWLGFPVLEAVLSVDPASGH